MRLHKLGTVWVLSQLNCEVRSLLYLFYTGYLSTLVGFVWSQDNQTLSVIVLVVSLQGVTVTDYHNPRYNTNQRPLFHVTHGLYVYNKMYVCVSYFFKFCGSKSSNMTQSKPSAYQVIKYLILMRVNKQYDN